MKTEEKSAVIDAILGGPNFNPEGSVGHTGILNRETTESYLNFRTPLFPREG